MFLFKQIITLFSLTLLLIACGGSSEQAALVATEEPLSIEGLLQTSQADGHDGNDYPVAWKLGFGDVDAQIQRQTPDGTSLVVSAQVLAELSDLSQEELEEAFKDHVMFLRFDTGSIKQTISVSSFVQIDVVVPGPDAPTTVDFTLFNTVSGQVVDKAHKNIMAFAPIEDMPFSNHGLSN